ncbi:MAG: hypothetical protein J0I06_21635 [Planctomycetes bacterium]|nr:hypothetical protein [Planctomycetota bacterium]
MCGWLVAGAVLALGVPLFLRMPLWCDATLYAVAARTVSAGGVHYRDVFDTNPPGFVWMLCAVRGAVGTSDVALRVADLLVVAAVTAGLLWWARGAGASGAGVAWLAAAVCAFYPFTDEFNHVQRDVWMMLPAGVALALRLGRCREEPTTPSPSQTAKGNGGSGLFEGLFWGLGCWVKPHLLFVAFAAWLATSRRLSWRDHGAVFSGGLVALAAGWGWLVASGAWPHFLDIWRTWNADYLATVMRELPFRVFMQLGYFPLYSVCVLGAVPLAVLNLREGPADEPTTSRRKALAAVYLAWLLTAFILQRPFHYVHVPETLLMLAVFAANRWPVPFALVALQVVTGAWFAVAGQDLPYARHHAAFDANRSRWWVACLDRDPPREVRRGVALWAQHFGGIDPMELGAAADFLRTQNVRDGELIAWHDSPHALYLELGVKPGFRFMHVGTAAGLGGWQEERVLRELREALPHARFVVSDMHRVTEKYGELNDLDADGLPKVLPASQRGEFPWNQPVVFRSPSGRYLVHRIDKPVTSAKIPQ